MDYVPAVARWLHFMAGVMWIGLLYYFNFVQVAALKAATADGTASGITKHVAPRALLYFRWAAVVTWLAGAALLADKFVDAFTLRHGMAGPLAGGAEGRDRRLFAADLCGPAVAPRRRPEGRRHPAAVY